MLFEDVESPSRIAWDAEQRSTEDGSRDTRRSAFLSLGNDSGEYVAGERRVVKAKQRVRLLIRGMRAKQGGRVASEMELC